MKVPQFPSVIPAQFVPQSQFTPLLPQASYSTQNLTQLLLASALQQQQQSAAQLLTPNFGVSHFSAATSLANSLSMGQQKTKALVANSKASYRRTSRRRPHSLSASSESENDEEEQFSDEATTLSPAFAQSRNALSNSSINSLSNDPIEQRRKAPSARKIPDSVTKVTT
jgi:hypothetical protein